MLLKELSLFIATPCRGEIPLQTVRSYLQTQEECVKRGVKFDFGFSHGGMVHHGRNVLAEKFLQTDASLLFWIDSDVVWEPTDFFRLILHSKKYDCVVGIYPGRKEPLHYFIKFPDPPEQPNDDGLVPILGTGLGFACVNRRVMEALAESAKTLTYCGHKRKSIFRWDELDGEERGEDYAFWSDVHAHGFKVWADTQASIGHVGYKVFRMNPVGFEPKPKDAA